MIITIADCLDVQVEYVADCACCGNAVTSDNRADRDAWLCRHQDYQCGPLATCSVRITVVPIDGGPLFANGSPR